MSGADPRLLWAPQAWCQGGWQHQVLLRIGPDGNWSEVRPGVPAPAGATVLPGPALPGLVNAHSHAFQRAFAGLAERREAAQDDFWSWRDRMYAVAQRLSPEALHAVAAQLYAELLQGGFTQVCEFHYLHHAPDGSRYADPLAMSRALIQAARDTGIGITMLPVLYERAGFAQPQLRDDQRRFASTVEDVLALRDAVRALRLPQVSAGVAMHSLRAVPAASMARLVEHLRGDAGPIHIHVAEQVREVDDCVAATGARPIEWLTAHAALDPRWQLVHATHATPAEIDAVAHSGAGVVLCPGTEANLGDGLCDLPRWLAAGVPLSIGTDSHVTRHWASELRLLEYGQRLVRRERNVAAAPEHGQPSSAARLFERAARAGALAAGLQRWGLEAGARADLQVVDAEAAGLQGVPGAQVLDAFVFAADRPALHAVWVAGEPVVTAGRGRRSQPIAAAFGRALRELWADTP